MMKFWMALSGLIMIGFLLAHMYGNLKLFAGPEAFNEYAHHLRVIGEPILPREGGLWIFRIVLLAAVIIHAWSAISLWHRDAKATGSGKRYQKQKAVQRSYASYTMRWGGVTLGLFIIFHLLNFTVKSGGDPIVNTGSGSPFDMVHASFQVPWLLIIYIIAMIAVGLHVWHGFWSAFATLGANTSPKTRSVLSGIAVAIAVILVLGFLSGPIAIAAGVI